MEYAYAALMLEETGEEINETNLTGVLEAAGVDVEESRVKALVAALEDVDIGIIGEGTTIDHEETDVQSFEAESEDTSSIEDGDVDPDMDDAGAPMEDDRQLNDHAESR